MARGFLLALGVMLALFFFLLGWLVSTPANAQEAQPQVCGPRRQVIDALKKQYGEEERWFGIATAKSPTVYLLLVSKAGSWTLLKVMPDVACGVASGTDSNLMFGQPV